MRPSLVLIIKFKKLLVSYKLRVSLRRFILLFYTFLQGFTYRQGLTNKSKLLLGKCSFTFSLLLIVSFWHKGGFHARKRFIIGGLFCHKDRAKGNFSDLTFEWIRLVFRCWWWTNLQCVASLLPKLRHLSNLSTKQIKKWKKCILNDLWHL